MGFPRCPGLKIDTGKSFEYDELLISGQLPGEGTIWGQIF
jgi:hypothetical protein